MEQETVWRALSSQHRRKILDLLRSGPKTTGDLTRAMPGLTRFAVMQHLGVLEESGLVLARKEGRNRYNYSNPALLRDLYEQWVNPIASSAAEAAQHLKRYAQTQHEAIQMNESSYRMVKIEMETRIRAPKSVVYHALTAGYPEWWPHKFHADSTLYFDNVVGGTLGERFARGGSVAFGTIMMLKPDEQVIVVGIGFMGNFSAKNSETLSQDGEFTVYKKQLSMWGEVPEELEKMLEEGSRQLMEDALKKYCEAKAGGAA
ncbi:MAG: helix-turn-helix domain-containing protein [Fimbriimonadaceae bacterium]|nr:helix-turn-helix domain-containing protein [Fimbriimonadaceae bacterium]